MEDPTFTVWRPSSVQSRPVRSGDSDRKGAVFSGSLDGHIRAYSTVGGKVLWITTLLMITRQ